MSGELQQWINSIDVCGDGKEDGLEYRNLKDLLINDAEKLRSNYEEGKISQEEYDRYLQRLKEILEKHHASVQDAYARYSQEEKVIFQETENKTTGLWKMIPGAKMFRNIRTERNTFNEMKANKDLLHGYTTAAGNYTIPVKVFEAKLKTDNFKDFNTKEIRSYLEYLLRNGRLNKETLKQKFGEDDKMMDLMQRWSNEGSKFNGKSKDTTLFKEIGEFVSFNKEKRIDEVMSEILIEKIDSENIKKAQKIFQKSQSSDSLLSKKKHGEKNENESFYNDQYVLLIDKAYIAFGKGKDKKKFQKKFEKLLTSGFSSYDSTFEMFGGDTGIKKFQEVMAEVSRIEKNKKQRIGKEIQEYLQTLDGESRSDFSKLSPDEQMQFAKNKNDLQLIVLLKQKQKAEKDSEGAHVMATSPTVVVTALNNEKRGFSTEQINKSIDISIKAEKIEAKIDITTIQSVPGLKDITNVSEVWEDPKKVELLVTYLRTKPQLTREEKDIVELIRLKGEETGEFYMAKYGITPSKYALLKKSGKIPDFIFAESLIGSIDSNTTFAQIDKRLDGTIENSFLTSAENVFSKGEKQAANKLSVESDFSVSGFIKMIDEIPLGQQVPIDLKNNDTLFVERNGTGFNIVTPFKTEYCKNPAEVGNYIDSRKFFHEIGCGFMAEDMDKILYTIHSRNAHIGESFMIKQGLPPEKRIVIMKAIAQTMQLPLICDGVKENELRKQFGEYERNHAPLQSIALKQKFIANGGFVVGRFLENIPLLS